MFYYRIGYCYKNEDGFYVHLPIAGEVTTDREEAEQWQFDDTVELPIELKPKYRIIEQ